MVEVPLLEKQYQQQIVEDRNFHEQEEEKRVRVYLYIHVYTVCVKKKLSRPYRLNGRNGRTTAGVDLHRTCDRSAHTVVSN